MPNESTTFFEKGQVVEIYEDWQNNQNLVGVACLKKYRKSHLPFIPEVGEDNEPNPEAVHHNITYGAEEWLVEWFYLTEKGYKKQAPRASQQASVRYVLQVGLGERTFVEEAEIDNSRSLPENFEDLY